MRAALAALVLALLCAGSGPAQARAAPPAPREALVRIPLPYAGKVTPYAFRYPPALTLLVYDTLLLRDARGVPRPWLARSVRTSADGLRVTVRLARGARWHDGRRVTASDVAFTFDYMRTRPHPRFSPQLRAIASVRVLARDRLAIRLRRRSPGFADQPLADVPILPRHIWAGIPGDAIPRGLPVGSGPYRVVRQSRARGYRFVAEDRYFLGRPGVRAIETRPLVSERAVTRAMERREVDIGLRTFFLGSEGGLEAQGTAFARGPSYEGTVLMFNVRRPPFRSVPMRRAVAHALDLPRIARTAAGSGDRIEPARRGMLHPRSRWAPRVDLHAFDRAAARTVLAAPGAPAMRVLAPRDQAAGRAAGRAVVAALRRAGARATLDERPASAIAAAVGQDRDGEDFELAIWSSPPLASHDPDYLRTVFGRDGTLNYSGYRSAQFERLADRVATARPARRRAAVADELRLLARDVPVVALYFDELIFVYRRAAWNRWTFIRGDGVLDKRSFVPAARRGDRPAAAAAPARAAQPARIGVLGIVALALLGLALAVVVVGSMRGRRRAP